MGGISIVLFQMQYKAVFYLPRRYHLLEMKVYVGSETLSGQLKIHCQNHYCTYNRSDVKAYIASLGGGGKPILPTQVKLVGLH